MKRKKEKREREIRTGHIKVFLLPFPYGLSEAPRPLNTLVRRPALDLDPDFELNLLPLAVVVDPAAGDRTESQIERAHV